MILNRAKLEALLALLPAAQAGDVEAIRQLEEWYYANHEMKVVGSDGTITWVRFVPVRAERLN